MSEENTMTGVLGEELETVADQPVTDSQNLVDQTKEDDYLAQFVGEGKQYKTVEEAAKALAKKAVNADQFIETLKKEKQELEARTQEAKTVEDIIAALNKENGTVTQDPSEEVPKGFTTEQLEEWFVNREKAKAAKAEEETKVAKIKENQQKSWELLSKPEYFGSLDNAKLAIQKYLEADPSRKEVINNLGGYDPDGLAKLLKAVTPKDVVNFSDDTDVKNIPTNFPAGKLSWEQVKQAEKENPKLKKDRKWQNYVTQNLEL